VIFLKRTSLTLIVPVIKEGLRFFVPGKYSFVPSAEILDLDFAVFQLGLALSRARIETRALGLTSTSVSELSVAYVFERVRGLSGEIPIHFYLFSENLDTCIEIETSYRLLPIREFSGLECRVGYHYELGPIHICDDVSARVLRVTPKPPGAGCRITSPGRE
jgi:hypothetical protein